MGIRQRVTKDDFRHIAKRKKTKPRSRPRVMYIKGSNIVDALRIIRKVRNSKYHLIEEISDKTYQDGVSGKTDHGFSAS